MAISMVFGSAVEKCCGRSLDEMWMAMELAKLLLETEPVDVVRWVLHRMGVSTRDWEFSYYEGRRGAQTIRDGT